MKTPKFELSGTLGIAAGLMAIIAMMILPVPALLLDVGLAISFGLAILIFTTTLFVERPLDFSVFPSLLLGSLILRLSLNISSTKLIIGEGHTGTDAAGGVIESFAEFIMGGNPILGAVVFLVLLIVNYSVITKGAARMAEVGARFALDGMPGKQLAIDSDVAAGAISHDEAKARREIEQKETNFFGSLDGVSKFVKGDAIAGLLITLLNLVVGLVIGIVVHGMAFTTAAKTFVILTVGDGLVSQLPAVIISIATALLLAKGGAVGAVDAQLKTQLGRNPVTLIAVAVLMLCFAVVPGLPFLPFMVGGLLLGFMGFRAHVAKTQSMNEEEDIDEEPALPMAASIGDLLDIDDVHIEFSPDLVNLVLDPGTGLEVRIGNMRRHIALSYGVIVPEVRLTDHAGLPEGSYRILIQGVEHARGALQADKVMALLPDAYADDVISEPVYGAPARWIDADEREKAALNGLTLAAPTEVLATHLLEVIKRNLSRLLSIKSLQRTLRELSNVSDPVKAAANQELIKDLIPDKVPFDVLHSVLRLLLDERISIRNLPLILEAISEARLQYSSPEAICEQVRRRLSFQMIAQLRRDDGTLPLLQLAPEWEDVFGKYQLSAERPGSDIALPPDLFNHLAEGVADKVRTAQEADTNPALVTSAERRRFLSTLVRAKGIDVSVLSFEEVGVDVPPALVGVVPA